MSAPPHLTATHWDCNQITSERRNVLKQVTRGETSLEAAHNLFIHLSSRCFIYSLSYVWSAVGQVDKQSLQDMIKHGELENMSDLSDLFLILTRWTFNFDKVQNESVVGGMN